MNSMKNIDKWRAREWEKLKRIHTFLNDTTFSKLYIFGWHPKNSYARSVAKMREMKFINARSFIDILHTNRAKESIWSVRAFITGKREFICMSLTHCCDRALGKMSLLVLRAYFSKCGSIKLLIQQRKSPDSWMSS